MYIKNILCLFPKKQIPKKTFSFPIPFFFFFSSEKILRTEKYGQDLIKFWTYRRNECRKIKALRTIVFARDNQIGGVSALGELSCHGASWWLSTKPAF